MLAIDIGGTTTKVAEVENGAVQGNVVSLPTVGPAEAFGERIANVTASAAKLGVAVAGFLDDERTRLAYNPNIAWLEGFPLKERLGPGAVLEVDSNAAALAEYRFGEGRGSKRFLCLAAGTGLGGGMVVGGRLMRIAHGCIGDVGHVVVEPDGPECACGGRGCAEAVIAMFGRTREPRLAERAGRALGIAMASLASVFFPDCIAIAGGVSEAGEAFLEPAEQAFRRHVGEFPGRTRIVKAHLGWQATLIGAACAAELD